MCRLAGVARSTYYAWLGRPARPRRGGPGRPRPGYRYTTGGQRVAEGQIAEWLSEAVAGAGRAYGYRKLTTWLRREHQLVINKKTVYRLCREAHLLRHLRPATGPRPPRTIAINRTVTAPNRLWEMDLKYGYIVGTDTFFYLASVIDGYDRSVVGYHLGQTATAAQCATAVGTAVAARAAGFGARRPGIRTDNGPQFISHTWAAACATLALHHERIPPATPNKNAHMESWHSLLERECLANEPFADFPAAYQRVTAWIRHYNTERNHGSVQDWPPVAAYRRLLAGTLHLKPVRA